MSTLIFSALIIIAVGYFGRTTYRRFNVLRKVAPAARFVIEFVRVNPRGFLGLTQSQFISLALIGIGAWKLLTARTLTVRPAASLSTHKR